MTLPERTVNSPVDPAVWMVLRTLLAFETLMFGAMWLAFLEHDSPDHAPLAATAMLCMSASAGMLVSVPRLQKWTELHGLRALLVWIASIPTVGQALALSRNPGAWSKLALEISLLSIVPVIVLAWQSSFRVAMGAVSVIAVAD